MDISFEFFPPNSSEADKKLWSSIKLLEPLNPKFVSVTYGAGGSTRERTHDCVSKILRETSLKGLPANCRFSGSLIIDRPTTPEHVSVIP